eukprot:s470_g4.t1
MCVNLSSYNYLGFGGVDEFCTPAARRAVRELGWSSCATRWEPRAEIHRELEREVAKYLSKEDALVLGMGFATNSTILPALFEAKAGGGGILVLSDELNHRSIVEGVRLSGATVRAFSHNSMTALEKELQRAIEQGPSWQVWMFRPWRKIFVVVEGIYSMEGDFCRLREIVTLKNKYGAYLYLDEAHSIGAVGQSGRGVTELLGVPTKEVDVMMGTFTKSFGSAGGYVAASKEVIAQLRRVAPGSVFAGAMAPPCAAQALQAGSLTWKDCGKGLDELSEECDSLRAEVANDPRVAACMALERDIEALQSTLESFGPKKFALVREQQAQLEAMEAHGVREAGLRQELQDLEKAEELLQSRLAATRSRGAEVEQQARSLVDMEVLLRAEDEAQELKLQVENAELETSKMRQNLAESWVTDAADGVIGDEMEHLEEMERNLQWLMKTQQTADNERQLVERLERKEGTLQKRLREVSEEKATLASARVDLGDAGKAMRETMASQSEGYVRQLTGLEEARRVAFSERVKLMQDCADLQDKLDELVATERGGPMIQGRHTKLQATCRSVADESGRLRDMNAVLGELLLSDELEVENVEAEDEKDMVMRVLVLQKKLLERQESYHSEQQKLLERIRSLERAAALPGTAEANTVPESSQEGAPQTGLAATIKSRVTQWRDALKPT